MAGGHPVPTVEVIGAAGRIVINASDLGSYKGRGYKLATEVAAETPEAPAAPEPPPDLGPEFDEAILEATVPKLREWCSNAGVDVTTSDGQNKAGLRETLRSKWAAGWRPPKEEASANTPSAE